MTCAEQAELSRAVAASETRVFTAPVHTAPSMLASIVSACAVVKVLAICAVGVVGSLMRKRQPVFDAQSRFALSKLLTNVCKFYRHV